MFKWIYMVSTQEFLYGGPYDPLFDPATQGLVILPRHPVVRIERFDVLNGIRPATDVEILAYDVLRASDAERERFDGQKMLKAVAIYFAQQLNVPLSVAKNGILTIYRGL